MSAPQPPSDALSTGVIAWMARNPVASNLAMIVVLVGGLLTLPRIKQEVFPSFDLDLVRITVPYPGASPEEVEQGIVLAVEEAVRGVDGVKRVTSGSSEGAGTTAVELLIDADPDRVLSDIKSAVDRIRSFPEEAEDPQVAIASRQRRVISLVLAGDHELSSLQELAERAREDLLKGGNVTQIDVQGIPALELAIEVPREKLEAYGLTLQDIANQIAFSSMELPGGGIKTSGGEILLRVSDRRLGAEQFREMIVRSTSGGASVRLGDIGRVVDGYADNDQSSSFNGKRAVRVTAYRAGKETPKSVSTAVRDYADVLRPQLPDNVELAIWSDDSELLAGRIDLLTRNAKQGLILVLIALAFLLDVRLAFWVAMGIPISFMGAFLVMPMLGLTINMVSLFALIIVLGMVVDDAIVVGESAYERMLSGQNRMDAAIAGAREMAVPVAFSILTTITAFSPLIVIPGVMGKIFGIIPFMVVAVLTFSVFESFFVLPAHLGHMGGASWWTRPFDWVQVRANRVLRRFVERVYRPAVELAVSFRYATIAVGLVMLMLAVGLVRSGIVSFNFFPIVEGDVVTVSVRFPFGTNVERSAAVGKILERSAGVAVEEFGGAPILRGVFTSVGSGPVARGPGGGGAEQGGHLVTVEVALIPGQDREFAAEDFSARWRALTPELIGIDSVTFSAGSGPSAGAAVEVQLSHRDSAVLGQASAEIAQTLASFSDLKNVENAFASGKRQLDFALKEAEASALGLSSAMVASQIRAAFYGAEALREQRGRNELKVMVRLPPEQRESEFDLETLQIRTPAGAFVPLSQVAAFERSRAPTTINRESGRRVVSVKAALAPGVKSPTAVLASLREEVLPALEERYEGLDAEIAGAQREQGEVFGSLGPNFAMAMFVIFALLAIPLKSYLQPIVIMSAIPFGLVGAILGHLIMGYSLSMISALGIIALSGVVVNDSLVLVETTNRYREEGRSARDAVIAAGDRRMRPILLTSVTTFFGLMPMIFETSTQARFLIPMAISLGFGVMFATGITLVLVPSLYLIVEDFRLLYSSAPERASDEGGGAMGDAPGDPMGDAGDYAPA